MTTAMIERTAQRWLNEEAKRRTAEQADPTTKLLLSPAAWVLPKLLRIVYQNSSQPVEVLAPLIREMLQDQAFATTGGDPCDCEQLQDAINQSVALIVRVLERARKEHFIA